jgi:hypothetical protein
MAANSFLQCIRTFNFCSLAPAAGLLGFSVWAEQFAFGSTAQFLVWSLAAVAGALFFLTLLGCVGSIKGATSILLIVSQDVTSLLRFIHL